MLTFCWFLSPSTWDLVQHSDGKTAKDNPCIGCTVLEIADILFSGGLIIHQVTLLIIILFINPMVSWIKILKTKNTRAVIKEKDTNRLSLLL